MQVCFAKEYIFSQFQEENIEEHNTAEGIIRKIYGQTIYLHIPEQKL